MFTVGIDYSLTSPAICIMGENSDFTFCKSFYLTQINKLSGCFVNNSIYGELHKEYTSEQERHHNIANYFLSLIPQNSVVFIEDYSFGSKGRVFNIAENCGLLKHYLWTKKIQFHTIAPTALKKFATSKGNANKEKMYESFLEKTKIDLISIISTNGKLSNPVTDIVDAYFICLYGKSVV